MAEHHQMPAVMTDSALGGALSWLKAIQYPEWMGDAACRPDDSVWFPTASSGLQHDVRLAHASAPAKEICAGCPVRVQCLEYAFETDEKHGVWGGLNPIERRELKQRRSA